MPKTDRTRIDYMPGDAALNGLRLLRMCFQRCALKRLLTAC